MLKLSITTQAFKTKPNDREIPALQFERSEIDIEKFAECIRKGHGFCHWFNSNTSEIFPIKAKKVSNFERANVVFIDVDDCCIEMNQLVSRLSHQPSISYTTPSNGKGGLFRYRLCYIFDADITSADGYKLLYDRIVGSIQSEVPNYMQKDNCGGSCAQYMNGNGSAGCEVIKTPFVYSFTDFGIDSLPASPSDRVTHGTKDKESISFTDMEFKRDLYSLQPTDLIEKYRQRYPFFDRQRLEYSDGYCLIPEEYKEVVRRWYWDYTKTEDGKVRRCSIIKKVRDGEHRRQSLYVSALVRRLINPDISLEWMVSNLIYERQYYYDNSDKVLTNQCLVQIAINALTMPIEDIRLNRRKKLPRFRTDRAYCLANGIKPKAMAAMVRKKLNDADIGNVYDVNLSVSDNLANMKSLGMRIGKSKLYQFCKENNINTRGLKK